MEKPLWVQFREINGEEDGHITDISSLAKKSRIAKDIYFSCDSWNVCGCQD